jgi:hypothetical protein
MTDSNPPASVLTLSEDELLFRLGLQLAGEAEASRGEDQENYRQRARNWLQRHWPEFRAAVAANPTIQTLRSDNALLVAELATILARDWLPGPEAAYAAAIIVKLGIDKLCGGQEPF